MILLLTFLAFIAFFYNNEVNNETYLKLNDFGLSLQQEFLRGVEVHEGYERTINIPEEINNREYSISIEKINDFRSELIINFKGRDIIIIIPAVEGDLSKGKNILTNKEGVLYIK